MVTVVGGAERKVVAQTAVVDESSDPKWGAEYCVYVPSLDQDLEFQVWHHNKVFKNELIGAYRVRMSDLTGLEMGIKIRGEVRTAASLSSSSSPSSPSSSASGVVGHLSILLCAFPGKPVPIVSPNTITPASQMLWTATPYPSFRLHLERFTYHPGETVKGSIIFVSSSTAPKRLDGLEISATGKTHYEFRSSQPIGHPTTKDFGTGAHKSSFDYFWFLVRCPVSGRVDFSSNPSHSNTSSGHQANGTRTEEIGTVCSWPFQFVLPSHLPPSYARQSFNTTYTFMATLHAGGGRVIQASKDVVVMPNFLTLPPPSLASSAILAAVSPSTVLQSDDPNVGVEWTSAPIAYIDHQHEVSVRVSNATHYHFNKLTMHLRTMRVYNILRPDGKGWAANTFLEQICESIVMGPDGRTPLSVPPAIVVAAAAAPQAPMDPSLASSPAIATHNILVQPCDSSIIVLVPQNTAMVQACYPSVPEGVFSELIQVHHWIELLGHSAEHGTLTLSKLPIYVTHVPFVPPYGLGPTQAALSLEPSAADSPVAKFRIAQSPDASRAENAGGVSSSSSSSPDASTSYSPSNVDPFASNHSLVIPLGGFTHSLYLLTQGTNAAGLQPQNTNQCSPLPHASFQQLHPTNPEQQHSAPVSNVGHFPTNQQVAITVEHSESFDKPKSGLARRPGDMGSVSINSNLGVNLNYQSFGLNDLNRSLFGGSSFGR